jgi:hypothetical protein
MVLWLVGSDEETKKAVQRYFKGEIEQQGRRGSKEFSQFKPFITEIVDKASQDLLAIQEFNSENETRKISPYKFLKTKRIFKNASWLDHIYILHVLDHTIRQDVKSSRSKVTLVNPYLSN